MQLQKLIVAAKAGAKLNDARSVQTGARFGVDDFEAEPG